MDRRDLLSQIMELEGNLRAMLDAERAPVMGPCLEAIRSQQPELLHHPILTAIRNNLGKGSDPPLDSIKSCFSQWPALSVLLLTGEVNEAYNDENDYAVHRAIESLIGARNGLSAAERRTLWREFRHACYRIGLKTSSRESGVGYMVEEFLHQSGLPLSFVERVTEQMIRTARMAGVPEEDDPEGLRRWQEILLLQCRYLPPNARKALEADETCYYSQIFLRVATDGNGGPRNTAKGIMARVLAERGEEKGRRGWRRTLRIPHLLWRDGEIVAEIPAGEDRTWTIAVDGNESIYRGESAPQVVPLMAGLAPTSLPHKVTITADGLSREYPLWEDEADHRFQIFGLGGLWLRAAALGEGQVCLPPGDYSLLMRFEPSGADHECFQIGYAPDTFLLPVALLPGEELRLRRGPAEVVLKAERRAWVRFRGDRLLAVDGQEVFHGSRLCIDLALGEQQEPGDDGETNAPGATRRYEIKFETGAREFARIPAQEGPSEIGSVLQSLSPGLHRLVAELCPAGTKRAIVRTSVLYWSGLDRQTDDGVLRCERWPENLRQDGCENTSCCEPARTIGPQDARNPSFRTEFEFALGYRISLDWQVPGVYLELIDYSVSPVYRRRLETGRTLAASPLSRQVLQIRSTEAGRLLVDGTEYRQLRTSHPHTVNLSALAEIFASGAGTLTFEAEAGQLRELVRIVAPHQILAFSTQITNGQCQAELCFALPCSQVRCTAENLLTGQMIPMMATCDDPNCWAETNLLRLVSRSADRRGYRYLLTIETRNLPAGAWFVDFEVCLANRWGAPINERQDNFAFGILLRESGFPVRVLESVLGCCPEPDNLNELLELFCSLHQVLQRCYAPESWVSLSWLKTLWERWLKAINPLDAHKTSLFVRLCEMTPPESSSQSWLPTQRVEASALHLFAQPARMYTGIYLPETSLGRCLTAIARLQRPLRRFPHELIDGYVAVGFGINRMVAGKAPGAFDFESFRKEFLHSPRPDFLSSDFLPSDGDLLSRTHYENCWEWMRERYRQTLKGNDARRQNGPRLFREVERRQRGKALCLRELERRHDEGLSIEDQLLCAIESFLSALARKCRQDVLLPGLLAQYTADLQAELGRESGSFPLTQVLSLVLQLGRDLFGFYLLLWDLVLTASENTGEATHG